MPFNNSTQFDNAENRVVLARELRFAKGFTLLFAVCNDAEERRRQIDLFQKENPEFRIQEVSVAAEIPHLLYRLRDEIKDPPPNAVCVYGMENWIRKDQNARTVPFLLNLNASRNHFLLDCPFPVLFWVPQYLIAQIADGAPDFFSVRSGVYDFSSERPPRFDASPSLDKVVYSSTIGLNRNERTARLAEMNDLLQRIQAIPEAQRDFAAEIGTLAGIAQLLQQQGSYAEAEPIFVKALALCECHFGGNDPITASSLNNLAELDYDLGRYSEAEPLYLRALKIREATLGEEDPETASSLTNLAGLYHILGRFSESEQLHLRALKIKESRLGSDHPETADSLNNLAAMYFSQGRYPEAEPLHKRALAIRESQFGADHPYTATSLNNLGAVYVEQGRYAEAEPLYKRALAIRESKLGEEHPDTANSLHNLASLYFNQGRNKEAESLYARAATIYLKTFGDEHPSYIETSRNLESVRDIIKSESLTQA